MISFTRPRRIVRGIWFGLTLSLASAADERPAVFRAGAAKIDITPAAEAGLAMAGYPNRVGPMTGVHDDLSVRAIVVDDGATQAAIVSVELIGMSGRFWENMTTRIAAEAGIARDNVFLVSVHTHSAPGIGPNFGPVDPEVARKKEEYVRRVEEAIVGSACEAKAALQPAKIGFGTGRANVNISRRARDIERGWWLGYNPDGASDKTVAVIKLETAAGEPLAILSNYSVHATVMGASNREISSDLPGATARFVEKQFGGKVVSPWTSGAGGDQAPIYDRNGTDFRQVAMLGQILGEEVVRVAKEIKTSSRGKIAAVQRVVSCPGKRTIQQPGVDREYKIEDTDPVDIRLSLLAIGDIALAGVSGEVLTKIGQRLKLEAPFARTMLITHCNGSSGYLPEDAAYDEVAFEVVSSRVKRGCAENAIVNGMVEMMSAAF